MRQLIINSFEMLVWVFGGIVALAAVIGGIGLLVQGDPTGLALIIGGLVYAVLLMGVFFLVIGIHDNTRRTAEAIEKLAAR